MRSSSLASSQAFHNRCNCLLAFLLKRIYPAPPFVTPLSCGIVTFSILVLSQLPFILISQPDALGIFSYSNVPNNCLVISGVGCTRSIGGAGQSLVVLSTTFTLNASDDCWILSRSSRNARVLSSSVSPASFAACEPREASSDLFIFDSPAIRLFSSSSNT